MTKSHFPCVFFVIYRNGILLKVFFDFLLSSFNLMVLSPSGCKPTGA